MNSRFSGSLWIKPRYLGYRVATTGQVARIDGEIAHLVGLCDGEDNKGYKYWYLDNSRNIDKIIDEFGRL